MMMRKYNTIIALVVFMILILCGCRSQEYDFQKSIPSGSAAGEPEHSDRTENLDISSVEGPYGELFVRIPDTWSSEPVHVNEEGLMFGLYGLILKPQKAQEGQIELFCSDSFGVCGTGLVQEEVTLATVKAYIGTYDDHAHWDFITFGTENPQIVAQHTDCDSWTDEMWDEAMTILDTMCWEMDKTDTAVIQTHEATDTSLSEEYIKNDKLLTLIRYYEMADGTWRTDDNTYKYRLEITGRMSGAAKDSTFIYLSNIEEIPFERAYMAAGLSSNMDDYFDPSEAVLVAMK